MIDPKRWSDEGGGATFEERELLRAGRDARLPDALRKRVWAGVATGLGAVETAAAAGSALQSGGAAQGALTLLSSTAVKGVAALAIAGSVGLGVASLRSPADPSAAHVARMAPAVTGESAAFEKSAAETLAVRAPELEAREPQNVSNKEIVGVPNGQESKGRTPRAARPNLRSGSPAPAARAMDNDQPQVEPSPEARRASRLAEESAAVVAIRKTLLAGEPAQALRMLDRASAQFPDGVLGQEREALAVRALVESGQRDAARRRGEAFLRAFPRSPHAAELRALLAL